MAGSALDKRKKTIEMIDIDDKKCIKKTYLDNKSFQHEISVLRRMSPTGYSPKLIGTGSDYIIFEYIEGELLSSVFLRLVKSEDGAGLERLADMVSIFLQIFYSCCEEYTIYDIEFSNFKIKDGRCYGLDFEDCEEGMAYRDIAGVVAVALVDCGDVSLALPFIKKMLVNFHFEIMDIINEVRQYASSIAKRRSVFFDVEEALAALLYLI